MPRLWNYKGVLLDTICDNVSLNIKLKNNQGVIE